MDTAQIPICSGEPIAGETAAAGRWRSQARRKAGILAASRALLAERGFGGFHIRTVARRSGVTPPTIYNLIGSRDLVLRNAIDEAIDAKFKAAVELATGSAVNILLAYADISVRCIAENPTYYWRILRSVMLEQSVELRVALVAAAKGKFLTHLRDMHRDGQLAILATDLDRIADILVRQNFSAAVLWAEQEIDLAALRRQLMLGVGLVLMGMVVPERREEIRGWMDALAAQPAMAPPQTGRTLTA